MRKYIDSSDQDIIGTSSFCQEVRVGCQGEGALCPHLSQVHRVAGQVEQSETVPGKVKLKLDMYSEEVRLTVEDM